MPSRRETTRSWILAAAAIAAVWSAGCSSQKVHASAPVLASSGPVIRPMTIAPDTDASPPLEAAELPPPALPAPSTVPPSVGIAAATAAPPPRRPVVTQPANQESAENNDAAKSLAPRITPQLSQVDQAAYQRKIDDDSSVATRNLQSAGGHQLNAAQQDLADKIRSFLNQSRDAGQTGDWARAQNLAQKARLLSVELINSL